MNSNGGAVRIFVIRAIDRCNGQPIPESTLEDAVRMAFPHNPKAATSLGAELASLAAAGYVSSGTQDLTGDTLWTLTDKGRLHASWWR